MLSKPVPSTHLSGGRRRVYALAAALAVLCGIAGMLGVRQFLANRRTAAAEELVRYAYEERTHGDLRGAAATLQRALQIAPHFPGIHLQLGIVYTDAREYDLARQELEQVTRSAPGEAVGWGQLGRLHLITARLNEAEQALQTALELRPDHGPYLAMLGEVCRLRGDTAAGKRAETYFRRALSQNPQDPDTYYRLGLLQQRQGRPAEALRSLLTAIQLSPETPEPYYAVAQVERSRGNSKQADQALRVFRRLNAEARARSPQEQAATVPVTPRAVFPAPGSDSMSAAGASRPADHGIPRAPAAAGAPAEDAPAAPPAAAAPAAVLVQEARRLFYNQGQPDAAIAKLEEARRADPRDPAAPYQLGLVLSFVGRKAEAETAFRAALALDSRNPRYHAWIGTLLLERGAQALPAALTALKQSVALDGNYAYGHYQLGRAYLNQNRAADAAPVLLRATTIDPMYREAWYSLGQCYQRLGKAPLAARALKRFRELDAFERERRSLAVAARARGDDPAPSLKLARFLAHNDQTAQAILTLEGLLERFPGHPEAVQLLGELRSRPPGSASVPRKAP